MCAPPGPSQNAVPAPCCCRCPAAPPPPSACRSSTAAPCTASASRNHHTPRRAVSYPTSCARSAPSVTGRPVAARLKLLHPEERRTHLEPPPVDGAAHALSQPVVPRHHVVKALLAQQVDGLPAGEGGGARRRRQRAAAVMQAPAHTAELRPNHDPQPAALTQLLPACNPQSSRLPPRLSPALPTIRPTLKRTHLVP